MQTPINPKNKDKLNLVPYPKKVERKNGHFILTDAVILYDVFDAEAKIMAKHIVDFTAITCKKAPFISYSNVEQKPTITYEWDRSMGSESYILDITESGTVIRASTKRGRHYAAVTLCQLLSQDGSVPCLHIEDEPDYQVRGISDDISRGQVSTLDHFKKIIRFCSYMKLNTYFLYIEDMIRFDTNPRIGLGRGALTKQELRELVAYADEWQVDIVPLFESLGHQANIVALPEYQELREGEGSYSFNPTDPRTLDLMDSFYKELSSVFPNQNLFAGMDETNDVGQGKSKEIVEREGHAKVYADYYNGLNRIAKKNGKRLWIYATLAIDYPEALNWMDKDIVMVNYTFFEPGVGDEWWQNLYTYMPILIEKGFQQVVSPGIWNWKMLFPDYVNAYKNIAGLNKAGIENSCIGTMGASWCDDGGENFREYNYYGYAMQAETAWNAKQPITQDILAKRFGAVFYGNENLGEAVYTLGQAEHIFDAVLYHTLWNNKNKYSTGLKKEAADCPKIQALLDNFWCFMDGNAIRNADNLQYISFAARRIQYVIDLTTGIETILSMEKELTKASEPRKKEVLQHRQKICQNLIDKAKSFKNEFEALWHNFCRIEGLDYNLERYDRLVQELEAFKLPLKKD